MAILGIDTVAVVVTDRAKALAWYRGVLGIPVAYIGPNDPDADPSSKARRTTRVIGSRWAPFVP